MGKLKAPSALRATALSLVLTTGSAGARALENSSADGDLTDERRVLRALAADAQPNFRAHLAEALAELWPEPSPEAQELLRILARDANDSVRVSAAVGLARAIERARGPERIDLVCSWAISESTEEKLALARALTWATPVFVADLVLEQLACDESPAVRAAALAAVAKHFHGDSATYSRIAFGRLQDADSTVRRLARALADRASAASSTDDDDA